MVRWLRQKSSLAAVRPHGGQPWAAVSTWLCVFYRFIPTGLFKLSAEGGELLLDLDEIRAQAGDFLFERADAIGQRISTRERSGS